MCTRGAVTHARASAAAPLILLFSAASSIAFAAGETFEVKKEEPATVYTRRWNWAHPRPEYYSTTQHGDSGETRLDESRNPDTARPYIYMGSATATFRNLPPGKYEMTVFYRKSTNRSRHVVWKVSTDSAGGTTVKGWVDQYEDVGCCGEWYLIQDTRDRPVPVQSTLTLKWSEDEGSYAGYDARSVAYGGVRVTRVSDDPEPLDGGSPDTGGPGGPCAAIHATQGFELCEETATTCAGDFTNGAGCAAYCAAANMICTSAFGASPGCQKEPQNPLACDATAGHTSDWCECAYPPGYDAGAPDAGAPDTGTIDDIGIADDTGVPADAGAPDDAGETPGDAGAVKDSETATDTGGDPGLDTGAPRTDAGSKPGSGDACVKEQSEYGLGCGCTTFGVE